MSDASQRFLFEDLDVRGEIVQLDQTLSAACEHHAYPPPVARLLGEALAAASVMRATVRMDGTLTLQVEGADDAPVSLVLVHADADGHLRGTVRYEGDPGRGGLEALCGSGRLAITIEPEEGQRYQGVVGLDGQGLAPTLEGYFRDSEQLPTRLHLASDGERAGGLLLQRIPRGGEGSAQQEADPDAWERIGYLAQTLTDAELLERSREEVLYRLFHEETVRVFEPREIRFRCRCSASRIASILRGLGQDDVEELLEEQGVVEVRCEFCGAVYRYDRVDVAQAFADAGAQPGSDRYH